MVVRSVGRYGGHSFQKGPQVSLPCSYRRTFLNCTPLVWWTLFEIYRDLVFFLFFLAEILFSFFFFLPRSCFLSFFFVKILFSFFFLEFYFFLGRKRDFFLFFLNSFIYQFPPLLLLLYLGSYSEQNGDIKIYRNKFICTSRYWFHIYQIKIYECARTLYNSAIFIY